MKKGEVMCHRTTRLHERVIYFVEIDKSNQFSKIRQTDDSNLLFISE